MSCPTVTTALQWRPSLPPGIHNTRTRPDLVKLAYHRRRLHYHHRSYRIVSTHGVNPVLPRVIPPGTGSSSFLVLVRNVTKNVETAKITGYTPRNLWKTPDFSTLLGR